MWGWILPLLQAVLPWLFSGEKKTVVAHTAGIAGLDRDSLSGKRDLMNSLPKMMLVFSLIACAGCQFGGKETTHQVIMVEPGDVVEIADDHEIQVIAFIPDTKEPDGFRKVVTKKKIAGLVAMPKAVYREMRAKSLEKK